MRQPMDDVYPGSLFSSHPMPLSILALFLRSYFVPFPFTYRILLSHEIDGVRKEKERLTASMSRLFSLHTRSSYSHLLPVGTRRETERMGCGMERGLRDKHSIFRKLSVLQLYPCGWNNLGCMEVTASRIPITSLSPPSVSLGWPCSVWSRLCLVAILSQPLTSGVPSLRYLASFLGSFPHSVRSFPVLFALLTGHSRTERNVTQWSGEKWSEWARKKRARGTGS